MPVTFLSRAAPVLLAALLAAPGLPPAPDGVEIQPDLPYLAPDRTERLDLYLPAHRAPEIRSPAVVIIHGGGWAGGSKSASREFNIGTTLAKAGYVAVSIDYRLEAAGRWPTNLMDCKNAVRYLRRHAARLQVDPESIGVIGGSAGGHLALMVGFTAGLADLEPEAPYPGVSSRVRAVVNLYGITNLRTRKKIGPDGTPGDPAGHSLALFGDKKDITDRDLDLGSPVTHVRRGCPPVLTLHGTADTTVDRDQAGELDRKLEEAGLTHQLLMIPGVGHTFDLQTWNRKPLPEDLRPIVVAFFDRYLKARR